jgi:hypothetical protein
VTDGALVAATQRRFSSHGAPIAYSISVRRCLTENSVIKPMQVPPLYPTRAQARREPNGVHGGRYTFPFFEIYWLPTWSQIWARLCKV